MVYDCFSFFNEFDLLEIRLNLLDKVVDRFVIVESSRTFQKTPKPYNLEEHWDRFKTFHHKIEYIKVDYFPNWFYKFRSPNPWDYDNFQKDQIKHGLTSCQPDDVIILSDLDEIPDPLKLQQLTMTTKPIVFEQLHTYYYLNLLELNDHNDKPKYWYGTVMMPYSSFKSFRKGRRLRDFRKFGTSVISDGGWHFGYLGGVKKIKEKFLSYAHTEHKTDELLNEDYILDCINSMKPIHEGAGRLKKCTITDFLPEYIQSNTLKYKELIID